MVTLHDALVVVFPTTKVDKEGANSFPKHTYANPASPEICPVLALAIFVWTLGFRREDSKPCVFGSGGKDVESRFSKWLASTCGEEERELLEMGQLVADLGTHSFRKGIAQYLSGIAGGPSPIAIYLRAGWSLGSVQKRYIMEGQGGDQMCGRAATGLSMISREFATLPPHFHLS